MMLRLNRLAAVTAFALTLFLTLPIGDSSSFAQERVSGFQNRTLAIVGGTVVPEPGVTIPNGVVLIDNGLIVAVGPRADVRIPAGAERIDADGHFVYAGWIDGGSSRLVDPEKVPKPPAGRNVDFSRYVLAATRTDNRRLLLPEFGTVSALQTKDEQWDLLRKAGFTAVHVLPHGQIANGDGCLVNTGAAPMRERILKDRTVSHFTLQRFGFGGYPTTLMGTIAHLRQSFYDAERHARQKALFDAGVENIPRPVHDPCLNAIEAVRTGNQRAIFTANGVDDVERALLFSANIDKPVALSDLRDAAGRIDAVLANGQPVLLRIPELNRPKVAKPKPDAEKASERYPSAQRVQYDAALRWRDQATFAARLANAGLPIMQSSQGRKDPADVRTWLRVAHEYGLTESSALASLTTHPAGWLGMSERLGKLSPGMIGNVTITNGPLLHKDAKVRWIIVEGVRREFNEKSKPISKDKLTRIALVAPRPAGVPLDSTDQTQFPTEIHSDRVHRPNPTGGDVLIQNATVLTGTGATLPKTSILVIDGKIARIGTEIVAPSGVRVIDASDMFVMPGIIDTHSHIMITDGINESSQSIVAEVSIRDVVDTQDVSEFRALAGGVTTARLLHGSANVIGGQHAVVKLKYGKTVDEHLMKDAPLGIKFALGENVKRNTSRFPNTRLGVEATLNRAFMEALDYRARWRDYERNRNGNSGPILPPRRDQRLETLAKILDAECFIHCHCYRADEILMLMRVADSLGVRIQSLQHVLEGYKVAPEIRKHGASCSTFADWWAYKVEAFDATPFNAAALSEAGINTVIKSDDWELIRHLYQEAQKPVRYGNVTPDRALQMITRNPSRELGISDRVGTIEIGKDADLAIFNGHPLQSFSRCEYTLINGEVYFDRSQLPTAMSDEARGRTHRSNDLNLAPSEVRSRSLDLSNLEAGDILITNATVHPVSGPVIEKGSILIEDGRISAVGSQIDVPSGIATLDASGLHVYPGMIDSGTTLGITEIRAVGETSDTSEGGDLQPDLRAAVAINPDSELIPVARMGGITTIHLKPTSGLISGQTSLASLTGWTAPEMTLRLEQGLQINWPAGSDPKRVKQLREFLEDARLYLKAKAEADDAVAGRLIPDPRYDALGPYLQGSKPVYIEANTYGDITDAVKFGQEEKLDVVITGGRDAWKVADLLKKHDIAVIVGEVMQSPADGDPQDAPYANPGLLHEAGVRFCIRSNDASNCRNAPFEAAMAVSHGLPEEVGLRSVTLSAAEVLGISEDLGSIDVGKRANLIITDGSPLQVTSQVKAVFINGKVHAPQSRQTRFYERYRQRIRPRR